MLWLSSAIASVVLSRTALQSRISAPSTSLRFSRRMIALTVAHAARIFERLRDEYGFTGGITIVKDYVAGWRQRTQEMFVPLVHPPGHAQADFGEAIGIIGGVERKIHFFAFDLPHSDACSLSAARAGAADIAAGTAAELAPG